MERKKFLKNITIFMVILFVIIVAACDNGTEPDTVIQSVVTPSAAPAGGTYITAQTVTLTTSTSGASIYYTVDGSNPTTGSALYASPISINTTTTLKAIAVKSGMNNSEILTAVYTINIPDTAATPTANPPAGTYTAEQTVTLTTSTLDAAIHYTIDGSNPTTDSALYASPITISTTTTLKAITVKSGMNNSELLESLYTITLPVFTVTFNADGGTPAPASPVDVTSGSIITQPPAMTKNWHTFSGWYTDSDCTVPAVFPVTVTTDVNLYVKWIVNVFTNIADASAYLASLPTNTSSNPAKLSVNFDLGTMTETNSGWKQLLGAINTSGKYVNLDISACTMSGDSFNPDISVATGKDKIVSIVLPAAATSIEASSSFLDNIFKNFSNLKSISGENVLTIGESAFYSSSSTTGNKKLQNIYFPNVTSIGNFAFTYCSGLQNADLPEVTNIGYAAFRGCTSLQSISFPASVTLSTINPTFDGCSSLVSFTITGSGTLSAVENGKALVRNGTELVAYPSASGTVTMNTITTIGIYAFSGCTGLQSVSFTQVTTIGNDAFDGCANLQSVNFPLATTIGNSAFNGCKGLQTMDFPQATSIGSQSFWSCSGLQSLIIPKVTSIGGNAFSYTGATALVITMGLTAPTLSYQIFNYINSAKTVTIKVPNSSASGYTPFSGSIVTVSGTDTTANWANGLRGGGWTGTTWSPPYSSTGPESINQNITIIIEVAE